jgi:type I restriction enzyme S subunit
MPDELSVATSTGDARPPGGWKERRLSGVAEVRFSGVDKITRPSEQPVRLCNYIDVYDNDYITGDLAFMEASATPPEIVRFGLHVGDVIITKDSETPDDIGIPAVVDYAAPDLVCGYHLGLIRSNSDEIDPTFLAKQLGHHRVARYFGQQANGLTRYALPIGTVNNAPLWLPEASEQRAIGMVLRRVDEAIAKTDAVISKLRQVRTGLLHDLFTRGLGEDGHVRDLRAHPELFKDSLFGRIPRTWTTEPLGARLQRSCGIIQTGPFGSQLHAHEYAREGVPVVMPQDILEGGFDDTQIARIATAKAEELRRHQLKCGDLLFARRGDLSRCAVVSEREVGWLCGTGCLLVRFEQATLSPPWVSLAYRHDFGQRQIAARAVGTTMVNLNATLLASVVLAFPPKTEQDSIVRQANETDALLREELRNLSKLRVVKVGVINDLVTGRVRVPSSPMPETGS